MDDGISFVFETDFGRFFMELFWLAVEKPVDNVENLC